jgi:hypothetical protein
VHILRLAARAPCRSGPVTSTLGRTFAHAPAPAHSPGSSAAVPGALRSGRPRSVTTCRHAPSSCLPAYSRSSPSGATRLQLSSAARSSSRSVVVGASRRRAAPRRQFVGAPPARPVVRLACAVQAALWATAQARPPAPHLPAQSWLRRCPPAFCSVASVTRRGLTCRSTGASTACRPGREALVVHAAPRGQGATPFRPGYLYVSPHDPAKMP